MIKILRLLLVICIPVTIISADAPLNDFRAGRYNNVCKDLKDDVLLYFVFIDTRTTYPWTEFDILSTIDSIHKATKWLESQAEMHQVDLNIKTDYYIGNDFATIQRNLPGKSIQEIVTSQKLDKGLYTISRWGDYIAKIIGESLYIKEKDGIPIQKRPSNKERLIAYLRDEYNVESVAMMLLVNNYFRTDISLAVNTLHSDDVEFCIVSYKYPTEIAHNFLHLFGAADLYETPFRQSKKRIKLARELYPYDIMQDPYAKNLKNAEIGDFTQYMIGWTDDLSPDSEILLSDRKTIF